MNNLLSLVSITAAFLIGVLLAARVMVSDTITMLTESAQHLRLVHILT